MNHTDILIIYLACGSPFGVYYFLQNRRRRRNTNSFWIKTILTFLVWLPFAIRLCMEKIGTDELRQTEVKRETRLFSIQKQIEAILLETNLSISIYELREVFDRYVGLSSVNFDENITSAKPKSAFFDISNHPQAELASICCERRNRNRLFFHHTLARQDFLSLIGKMSESGSEQTKLGASAAAFAAVLNDSEAQKALELLFAEDSQTAKQFAVTNLEKDLWKPEKHKPLPTISPISTQLQTMSATAAAATTNSRSKD